MNEIEIQERIREAIGESRYPEHLPTTVEQRLGQSQLKPASRLIPMVAGSLALLIVLGLLAPRLLGERSPTQNAGTGCTALASDISRDLPGARLSNVACLVTPFGQTARDSSGSVTLLAGYSDDARTVLIFHMEPFKRAPDVAVSDDRGPLTSGANFTYNDGDTILELNTLGTGPHPGGDGLAHLNIVVDSNYHFEIGLKVQTSISIPVPEQFQLGSSKVNLQFAKVTPNAIVVRALVTGSGSVAVGDLTNDVAQLLDSDGIEIDGGPASYGPVSASQVLLNLSWMRPPGARSFVLRFQIDGATKTVPLTVPATNGWIAYSTSVHPRRGSTDQTGGSDIYVVREGAEPRLIAGRQGGAARNVCPAFSPDGLWFAFGVASNQGRWIVALRLDSGGVIKDTSRIKVPGNGPAPCVRWSLDGSRIGYIEGGTVVVRNLDGSTPALREGDATVNDFADDRPDPLLSPTGDRTVQLGSPDAASCEVIVARPGGADVSHIALGYCPYAIAGWSPDAKEVLLMQDDGSGFTIWAVSVDSPFKRVRLVSHVPVNNQRAWPGWGDVSWQAVYS